MRVRFQSYYTEISMICGVCVCVYMCVRACEVVVNITIVDVQCHVLGPGKTKRVYINSVCASRLSPGVVYPKFVPT